MGCINFNDPHVLTKWQFLDCIGGPISKEDVNKKLDYAVELEDYEFAQECQDELNRRANQKKICKRCEGKGEIRYEVLPKHILLNHREFPDYEWKKCTNCNGTGIKEELQVKSNQNN